MLSKLRNIKINQIRKNSFTSNNGSNSVLPIVTMSLIGLNGLVYLNWSRIKNQGKIVEKVLSPFYHTNTASLLINSICMYTFARSYEFAHGGVSTAIFVACTIAVAEVVATFIQPIINKIPNSTQGNFNLWLGFIYNMAFKSWSTKVMLFPIPFKIRAKYVAIALMMLSGIKFNLVEISTVIPTLLLA